MDTPPTEIYTLSLHDALPILFSATVSPAVAKRTALKQYLQTFFGGSVRQLVAALVRDDSWNDEELRELRSEEHTSELQSQSNLVCRLLLEKKKKKKKKCEKHI